MKMSAVHVIAEAGTNHNGCVDTGCRLIDAAAAASADSVKFQMIWPAGLYVPRIYRDGDYTPQPVYQQREATVMSAADFRCLAAHAVQRAIPFSASVFDGDGIAVLDELNVDYIKIASCDLNNFPFLRTAALSRRRLIVSTGMSTLSEIEQAVATIRATDHDDFVLMHCVSLYPAPMERMNLGFIDTLRNTFGCPVGFSDHTSDSRAAQMAIAKGATFIEKHFTLDRRQEGFDHAYALEPDELAAFVEDVRQAEAACVAPATKVSADEQNVRCRARRALYASRDIAPGEVIRDTDVLAVRPEGPLAPGDLTRVVGAVARGPIRQHEPFDWSQLALREDAAGVATGQEAP